MKEREPEFAKLLAGRFETTLTKYRGFYYLHIKDNKEVVDKKGGKKTFRRVSLNADALKALSLVLPDILKITSGRDDSSPPPKKRRKLAYEPDTKDSDLDSDYSEDDLITSLKQK